MQPIQRILDFWFEPIHPLRLETFQRVFSATFLVYMIVRFSHVYEWLTPYGFHLTDQTKNMATPPILPLLPQYLVLPFGVVLFGGTLALIVGWRSRIMIWPVLACAVYVQLADIISAFTLNKYYIVVFCVLALASPPRRFVHGERRETAMLQSAWPLRTLQATLLVSYFTAGSCKLLHGDWVTNPDVLWTQVQGFYCTDLAAWMLRIVPLWAWSVMMYSSLVFELSAPLLLGIRRLRPLGFLWGAGFHLVIALTMYELIYFSWQLMAFYILFLDPRLLMRVRGQFLSVLPFPARTTEA